MQKQMRILENRLEKAYHKYNESQSHNQVCFSTCIWPGLPPKRQQHVCGIAQWCMALPTSHEGRLEPASPAEKQLSRDSCTCRAEQVTSCNALEPAAREGEVAPQASSRLSTLAATYGCITGILTSRTTAACQRAEVSSELQAC